MKTFGRVIVEARKAAGLTQKAVAQRLRRGDGRAVMPTYLNYLEHDRRRPPESTLIEQLAEVLKVSPDFPYFYARCLPTNVEDDFDERSIQVAYAALREKLRKAPTAEDLRCSSQINANASAWA